MRIPEWRDLRKPAPLLGILVAALLVVALAFRGWDSYVEDRLGRWAVDELARQALAQLGARTGLEDLVDRVLGARTSQRSS